MELNNHKSELITDLSQFKKFQKTKDLDSVTLQNLDFIHYPVDWENFHFNNTVFLGCKFTQDDFVIVINKGGYVFPKFSNLPFKPYRDKLYHWKELMNGYSEEDDQSIDYKIYTHFKEYQKDPPIYEALAERIHDNSIDNALRSLLEFDENGNTTKKLVGFMGGHSLARGSEFYIKTALAAKLLTQAGYYIVTGGGPGVMEAANLGAYLANHTNEELLEAIKSLEVAPVYTCPGYIQVAMNLVEKYPKGQENLAIPTWFYGHEPSNLFSTHIAKYFSNSIREDTLLAISLYGVVYAPGSAGTTQEIFQEAAQNHYGTYGYYSPMIFFSKERYLEDTSIYSTLHQLANGMEYKKLLYVTDSPNLVLSFIQQHPPIKVKK